MASLVGGGVFLLAAVAMSGLSALLSYVFICLAGIGLFGPLGPFFAIPFETLPKKTASSAIGLINAVGSLGGYFGPLVVGYLERRTGNFDVAFSVLAIAMLLGAALTFLLEPGRPAVSDGAGEASTQFRP
jgi:sugar phosphate permease